MSFKSFFLSTLAGLAVFSLLYATLVLALLNETSQRVTNGRLASDAVLHLKSAIDVVAKLEAEVALEGERDHSLISELAAEADDNLNSLRDIHSILSDGDANSIYWAAAERNMELKAAWDLLKGTLSDQSSGNTEATLGQATQVSDLLSEALQLERGALAQKRDDADEALRNQRLLAYGGTLLFLSVCAVVALQLRALLDPAVAALEAGLAAIKDGRLDARVHLKRMDEFGRLAEVFNFAASKLEELRQQDVKVRQDLENIVETRTRELSRAMQAMQDLANQRSKLISELSHELRTPLTIIRGEADVALRNRKAHTESAVQVFEVIVSASKQMIILLDDLLNASRDSDPTLSVKVQAYQPDQCVQAALQLVGQERALFDVRLEASDTKANVDPLRLQQSILVLFQNAISYSENNTRIAVRSFQDQDFWCFAVTDYGLGIVRSDMHRIFERGYRGEAATERRPDGLGYGLSIAHDLIERMGGTLEVESAGKNMGSTFLIRLPVIPEGSLSDTCPADRG